MTIESEWPLNLSPREHGTSVDLRIIKANGPLRPDLPLQTSASGIIWAQASDGRLYLARPGYFEFAITADGRYISVLALADGHIAELQTILFGPVISFALLKRGIEQTHSTAIVVDGAAAAFIGESTFGKSTLAASFLAAGHKVLTDDLLLAQRVGESMWAQPGLPRLKLFPEAAKQVLARPVEAATRSVLSPKLLLPLSEREFQPTPVRLKAVYALSDPDEDHAAISIEPLSKRDAFLRILESNYNTVLSDTERGVGPFKLAADIASTVPVASLSYSRNFSILSRVRDAVLSDLTRGDQ